MVPSFPPINPEPRIPILMQSALGSRRWLAQTFPDLPGSSLERLAGGLLELHQLTPHQRAQRGIVFRQACQPIQGPGPYEGLGKLDVLGQDLPDPDRLLGSPAKERQGADELQPDLPL